MPCYLRLMCKEDVAQVTAIDREVFPSMWPPVNYHHELKNRMAHYVIACSEEKIIDEPEAEAIPVTGFSNLIYRLKQLFNNSSDRRSPLIEQNIFGFAGFWMMAEEAHIINIAVREQFHRQGMGELLLISMVEMATELKAHIVTLEVRPSNTAARRLYDKYDFFQVGIRHGYYTDNKEDGIIMSTENVTSASYQARLQQLKEAHSQKWGPALCQVAH